MPNRATAQRRAILYACVSTDKQARSAIPRSTDRGAKSIRHPRGTRSSRRSRPRTERPASRGPEWAA